MIKHLRSAALLLVTVALIFGSCKDPYIYDDQEPEWLGASIYDYLKGHKDENGKPDFTYFVRIIDSCNYAEVLGRTGSKTMFVCYDSAFESYFRNNSDGITKFEDFTHEQLNQIMEYAMVNEANLIETLSFGVDYVPGQVLTRTTSLDPFDVLEKETAASLPDNAPFFNKFKTEGKDLYILNDNTYPRLVHFLEAQMAEKGITDEDFSIIFNGAVRQKGDAHLFDKKVIERDITCKNGYIHVLDALMLPPGNMADFIRKSDDLTTFNRLMDRFSAPYADMALTAGYKKLHEELLDKGPLSNGFTATDSIYVRRYFSSLSVSSSGSVGNTYDPMNQPISSSELLVLDPNWNAYQKGVSGNSDMAAMFVPSDQAMREYFSSDPDARGNFLYNRYGIWDSVPNDIAALFLNSHMQTSFLASLPSKFSGLKNESLDEMYIEKKDVDKAKVTSNGVVYVTNRVFPPVELSSVMAPVLVREDTKIFNYPVNSAHGMGFDIYLKSMESKYNPGTVPPYTFIVPLDNAFGNYIYPAKIGNDFPEMLTFEYDPVFQTVKAVRYLYDGNTGQTTGLAAETLEYATLGSTTMGEINGIVKLYLSEMMDYHIIVGEVTPEQKYYQTKGKGYIYVDYDGNNYTMYGGGNMEQNKKWGSGNSVDAQGHAIDSKYASKSVESIDFENGKTIFIDKVMQQPLTSLYSKLGSVPQFKAFFDYMKFVDETEDVFTFRKSGAVGADGQATSWLAADQNYLDFFTAYHYTVYVPNNEAMQRAFDAGLPTAAQIKALPTTLRAPLIAKALDFIKYHVQDNSVFIQGDLQNNTRFETALRNPLTGKFYSLNVTQDGTDLKVIPTVARLNGLENKPGDGNNNMDAVSVVKNDAYNLMTRDLVLASVGTLQDTRGSSSDWSARAVVHEIDNYLRVIKPATFSAWKDVRASDKNLTFTMSVADTGDGAVYNGSGSNAVITEKGLYYAIGEELPTDAKTLLTSSNRKLFNTAKDLDVVQRKRLEYSEMDCLSAYYTDGVRNGVAVAAGDSVVCVKAYAVSRWADDGTAMAEGKTPLVGFSDAIRINWVTGKQLVNNNE